MASRTLMHNTSKVDVSSRDTTRHAPFSSTLQTLQYKHPHIITAHAISIMLIRGKQNVRQPTTYMLFHVLHNQFQLSSRVIEKVNVSHEGRYATLYRCSRQSRQSRHRAYCLYLTERKIIILWSVGTEYRQSKEGNVKT